MYVFINKLGKPLKSIYHFYITENVKSFENQKKY